MVSVREFIRIGAPKSWFSGGLRFEFEFFTTPQATDPPARRPPFASSRLVLYSTERRFERVGVDTSRGPVIIVSFRSLIDFVWASTQTPGEQRSIANTMRQLGAH